METASAKNENYIVVGAVILFIAAVCGAVYYYVSVMHYPVEYTSEIKEVKAVVMESGKSIQIGSEADLNPGFTMDGKVGFIAGSRPVSEEVYKVVVKLPINKPDGNNLLSVRGAEDSYAQRLSYDVRTGDTVQVSYVVRDERDMLSHSRWWVVKSIKKPGV